MSTFLEVFRKQVHTNMVMIHLAFSFLRRPPKGKKAGNWRPNSFCTFYAEVLVLPEASLKHFT